MQSLRFALACTLVLLSACQPQTPQLQPLPSPITQAPVAPRPAVPAKIQAQALVTADQAKPGHSSLRFSIGFQELIQSFAVQELACDQVAFARVEVSGIGMPAPLYARGADDQGLIPLAGDCGFSAVIDEVPYGPVRLIRVTLFDTARQPLGGGRLEGVSPIDGTVTSIELSYRQTLTARLVAELLTQGPAGEFRATQLDLTALQGFIDRLLGVSGAFPYRYAIHPTLIDLNALSQRLISANWNPAGIDPADPALRYSPQSLALQISGYIPGQPFSLSLDDPLSIGLIGESEGDYSLSGVPPGNWVLTLSGPGYISQRLSVTVKPDGTHDLGPLTILPPAPEISGYAPGDIWSGGPLKILGSGFNPSLSNNIVRIGELSAPPLSLDAEGLTVSIPAGLSGTPEAELRIGALSTPLAPVPLARPELHALDPGAGRIGDSLDLSLSHISPTGTDNRVRFGEGLAAATSIPGGMRVTVPDGSWGRVPVTVQTFASARSQALDFLVIPAVGADTGHGSAGFPLTIQGTGFAPTAANNTVRIKDVPVPASLTDGDLQVTIPEGLYGAVPLTVQTSGGAQSTPYRLEIIPWIAAPAPSTGSFGDLLQLSGTGFDPSDTHVTLGDTHLTTANLSVTAVDVTLPDAPAGVYALRIRVGSQSSAAHSIGLRPQLNAIETARTYNGKPALIRSSTILLGGSNFDLDAAANNSVGFGDLFVPASAVTADRRLLVEVPRNLAVGDLGLRVRTNGQTSEALSATVPPIQANLNGGFY